jgi:hypothetical protein
MNHIFQEVSGIDRSVFLKVLKKIEDRLRNSDVNWAVTGRQPWLLVTGDTRGGP